MALLYITLQDHERALDWLDEVRADGGAWFLKVNPPWDRLQSNPRFHAIVRRVGLDRDDGSAPASVLESSQPVPSHSGRFLMSPVIG